MNMRERVARAIEARLESVIVEAVTNAGEGTGPYPSDYLEAADAVLDAMRDAPDELFEEWTHQAWRVKQNWQALIDRIKVGGARDSDRSGEAGETTQIGSTEGESAGL